MTSIKGVAHKSRLFHFTTKTSTKRLLVVLFCIQKMNFSTKEFRLKTRGIKAIFQKSTKLLNMKSLDNGKFQ